MNQRNKEILQLAIPSIVSNVTVPLLGLVDLAIVGHIGNEVYISAIAVGSMIFNVVYWVFGFLRMGTSGLTAQAFGRKDTDGQVSALIRSLTIGILIGLAFIALQYPLKAVMMWAMNTPVASVPLVARYFGIVIWGAPAMLGLYGLTGWFIGMQDTRTPMVVALFQNGINILASLFFVIILGWDIQGVAAGTLIAQWSGFLMAAYVMTRKCRGLRTRHDTQRRLVGRLKEIFAYAPMARFFTVNRDIFLRTLCLVAVNLFFTSAGGSQGSMLLAVNTLLMTLFTLFSYVMDGFAYAGEALSGKYYGAGDAVQFRDVNRWLFIWGFAVAMAFTAVYVVGGESFLGLLTSSHEVVSSAEPFLPWAYAIPLCGVAAFIYDGIFIGITASRGMLVSSAVAAAAYFTIYMALRTTLGNHALWLAFLVFLIMRGLVQWRLMAKHEFSKTT